VHTAQELAHLASIYGVARVSFQYLARKCRCSPRTAIRHIQHLIDLQVIRKSVLWRTPYRCEVNTYTFLLAWERHRPQQTYATTTVNLPPPRHTSEKWGGVGQEIQTLEKGLRFCTPGSDAYVATQEKITHLRGLVPEGPPMA
jgi:hypothetical protein